MPTKVNHPIELWFFAVHVVLIIILSLFIWLGVIFINTVDNQSSPADYKTPGYTIISISGAAIAFILATCAYFIKGRQYQQAHNFVFYAVRAGGCAIVIDIFMAMKLYMRF
jgi:hypothetical protein